jgi:hypothetical protein
MNKKIFRLWGMPVLLAVLSLYGLISALIGKGIWDILACRLDHSCHYYHETLL